MKIISAGTPYLEKKPCSLAVQRGRTLAFTAAWAMTVLAGADAASRALGKTNSPRITNKKVVHLLIADSLGSKSQSEKLDRIRAENFFLVVFGYFVCRLKSALLRG
jgi:hypothetical protein